MNTFGSAFSDSLIVSANQKRHAHHEAVPWWAGAGRALVFASVLCVGFFVLGFRLFHLTVVQGKELRTRSDTNRTRALVRHAPRGLLLDRSGKPLVVNIPRYRLIRPCSNGQADACVQYISKETGDKALKEGLPANDFLEVDYLRQYPYGEALVHVLGYTGELSGEELASEYYRTKNYFPGDRVGRMGAEEVYNERLRGRDGQEFVEVDASGNLLRFLGRQEALAGEDIVLSLDAELSASVQDAFPKGEKGAVIVSQPDTGEILAMYSSPGFSPDAFSLGISQTDFDTLLASDDLPMFNRSIGGRYPPGSTFKLVTALAALEEGAITKTTTIEDTGIIRIGQFTFPNWYYNQYGKTEGTVDVVKALQRSNDIFFYKTGEWLGITKLVSWAKKMGIGAPLGIELSGETGGLLPDPAWKKQHFSSDTDRTMRNDEWYLGDTYHASIGQGYVLTTPLAVNTWTNIVANGGKRCSPTIEKTDRAACDDLRIDPLHIDLVTRGMIAACSPGGTGWPLFAFSVTRASESQRVNGSPDTVDTSDAMTRVLVPVACKTGTAEFGDPDDKTHAWFTTFAPLPAEVLTKAGVPVDENVLSGEPEISVTVLVEEAGEGSDVAAPVAKKILEEWFSR